MCDVGEDDLDNYGFLRSSNSESVSASYGMGGSSVPILKVLLYYSCFTRLATCLIPL